MHCQCSISNDDIYYRDDGENDGGHDDVDDDNDF